MIKKHFKFLTKIIIFIITLIFINSCDKKNHDIQSNNYKEVIFNNISFKKELDNFIKDPTVNQKKTIESMIVTLYINQDSDTIISITNFKPYETVNLVAINSYEKYNLYFYASKDLLNTLNNFIDVNNGIIQEVTLEPVDENEIDPIHSYSCHIKNNKIVP